MATWLVVKIIRFSINRHGHPFRNSCMQIQSSNHLAKLHQILDQKFPKKSQDIYFNRNCVTVFMYNSIVAEIPWQLGSSPEKILGEFLLLLNHLGL